MNKEQFAQLLNNRDYRNEITDQEGIRAREGGLLICFGASDDLLEFRGIICDEVGSSNGATALLVKKKGGKIDVLSEFALEEIQETMDDHDLELVLPTVKIVTEWCPNDLDCSWRITTDLPHATFDIMEDEELYCRGIVIEKSDIEKVLSI